MNLRTLRTLGTLGAVALIATLAGCGKSLTAPVQDSAAQQDADDAAHQVAMTMTQGSGGSPQTSAAPSADHAAAGRSAGSLQANAVAAAETTFTSGHITWTLTRAWFDAGSTEQLAYNPLTTVRMLATARGTGSISTATDTTSFGSAGTLDVHGISALQDTLVTSAARNDTVQAVFTPPFRGGRTHLYAESAGTWSGVTQLKPVSSNPWPLSGSATWTLHVTRLRSGDRGDVLRTFDTIVVVIFNGTRYPDVTVTGGFRYRFDLLTGAIARR